jgi:hypothetical protein
MQKFVSSFQILKALAHGTIDATNDDDAGHTEGEDGKHRNLIDNVKTICAAIGKHRW